LTWIILGGTQERGVSTLEPNEGARKRVVEGHIELFWTMRPAAVGARITKFEAPRETPSRFALQE
jgi:hypothetical protein